MPPQPPAQPPHPRRSPGVGYPGGYAPAASPYAPDPAPSNGLGTAALVLGILAILVAFVPLLGFSAYPLSLLGIVFGLVGLRKVSRGTAMNRGVAVAGLITSVLGLVLVGVSTALYVGAINAGVQGFKDGVDKSFNAVHHITYTASSSTGGDLDVSYSQGRDGSGSQSQARSPWSVDTTVTGSFASLTASSGFDAANPGRQQGVTCSIVDRDTGKTLVTNTVPPSGGATVTCTATNLGTG